MKQQSNTGDFSGVGHTPGKLIGSKSRGGPGSSGAAKKKCRVCFSEHARRSGSHRPHSNLLRDHLLWWSILRGLRRLVWLRRLLRFIETEHHQYRAWRKQKSKFEPRCAGALVRAHPILWRPLRDQSHKVQLYPVLRKDVEQDGGLYA
jgi:hypothetical protein